MVWTLLFRGSVCVHVSTVPLRKKKTFIFRPQPSSDDFLPSLPPYVLPSPPPLSSSSLSPPSLLDWWSKHRKRAGSVPPRQSWAGRSCRAPALGSKVYCGFHFTFPQPITEPHWRAWTLTPGKNSTQKMVWRQFHNCNPSHLPFFSLTTPFPFFQLASFMCWQSLGKKDSRNEVQGESELGFLIPQPCFIRKLSKTSFLLVMNGS